MEGLFDAEAEDEATGSTGVLAGDEAEADFDRAEDEAAGSTGVLAEDEAEADFEETKAEDEAAGSTRVLAEDKAEVDFDEAEADCLDDAVGSAEVDAADAEATPEEPVAAAEVLDFATHAGSVQVMTSVRVRVMTEVTSEASTVVMVPEVIVWPAGQTVVVV